MNAAILLVGQYPVLLATRADLLRDWHTVATDPVGAIKALQLRSYDLLILCQSVPDSIAKQLIADATSLHPGIKVLALAYDGEDRNLGTVGFTPDIYKPSHFKKVVADVLKAGLDSASSLFFAQPPPTATGMSSRMSGRAWDLYLFWRCRHYKKPETPAPPSRPAASIRSPIGGHNYTGREILKSVPLLPGRTLLRILIVPP
jgi:hypothetical protein